MAAASVIYAAAVHTRERRRRSSNFQR